MRKPDVVIGGADDPYLERWWIIPHNRFCNLYLHHFLRRATFTHRIELTNGPVWTLFLTGPKVREWGFHCPQEWRHWTFFTNPKDGGQATGRGCD